MTVKELINKLSKYLDNFLVLMSDAELDIGYTAALDITRGVNEFDGCVFIDKSEVNPILENNDWIVEYDAENNHHRVGYFQDNHFVDEVLFNEVDRSKSIKNKKCEHEWEFIGTVYTGLYTIRHYKCTKCGVIESISLSI